MLRTFPAIMTGLFTFAALIASETTDANARACAHSLYGAACIEPRSAMGGPGISHFNSYHKGTAAAARRHYSFQRPIN